MLAASGTTCSSSLFNPCAELAEVGFWADVRSQLKIDDSLSGFVDSLLLLKKDAGNKFYFDIKNTDCYQEGDMTKLTFALRKHFNDATIEVIVFGIGGASKPADFDDVNFGYEPPATTLDFNNDNWQGIVEQLNLGKFIKEFAKHLSVIEYEEGVLTLGLPKEVSDLLDSECALKIELAIQEYTSDPDIDVHVCVIDDDGEAIIDDAPPVEVLEDIIELSSTERENGLMVFDFEENIVRTILNENGETLFFAKDVCNVLGYANASDAVIRHCKNNGIVKHDSVNSVGKKYQNVFINEPNLMRLVVKSKLPAAEKFESWVFDEVLPTIRKTGKYETPNKKIDLLSPKFIAAMRKVRTVQLATGMTKVQSSKFAREVIKREFGADMVHEVIGDYLQQLDLV
jgi:prophage antirepressor-like protein